MTVPIGLSPALSAAAVERALRDPLHCGVEDHSAGALLSVLAQWDAVDAASAVGSDANTDADVDPAQGRSIPMPMGTQEVAQAAASPDPEAALGANAVEAALVDPSVEPLLLALRERLSALQSAGKGDHWATCAQDTSAWLQGDDLPPPWATTPTEGNSAIDSPHSAADLQANKAAPISVLHTPVSAPKPVVEGWVLDCAWVWALGGLPSPSEHPQRWQELLDHAGFEGRSFFERWARAYALGRFTPSLLGIWGQVGAAFAKALPRTSFGEFNGPTVSLRLLPLWACLPGLSPQEAAQIKSANAWMAVCAVLCCDAQSASARAQDLLALAEELRQGRGGLRLAARFGRLSLAFWPRRWMDRAWPGNLARLACLASLIAGGVEGRWLLGFAGLVAFFILFMVLQSWRMARALWIGRPGWEKGWPSRAVDAAWQPLWKDAAFVPPPDPHAIYAQKTGSSKG